MSFRLKTILGIALIQATLFIILIITGLNFVKQSQNREINELANTTASVFASASREAVLSSDLATLQSATDEILNNQGIMYAKVIDAEGKIMAQSGDASALQTHFTLDNNLQQAMNDRIFDISKTIEIDGSVLGVIQIGISTDDLFNDINRIRNYSLSIAGIEMILMVFLSFLLGNWLTKQLATLKDAATSIEQGELGRQVKINGNDEIAQTARAFNKMSSALMKLESQRIETIKALEISEERSRLLLNSAADGIFEINMQQKIIFLNQTATALLGFSSDNEIINTDLSIFFKDQQQQLLNIAQCLKTGKTTRASNLRLNTINKKNIDIDYTCSALHKKQIISGAVITFSDISKRKETEQIIEKAHRKALEHAQAKANFMANMSHEIRTPLHGIIGLLQLIKKEKLPDDYANYIEKSQTSADQLMHIIDEILDFSKIDSGTIKLRSNNFELASTLSECIKLSSSYAKKKNLKLTTCYTFTNHWVKGDSRRLQQIINTLIDNAIKFTQQGSIELHAELIKETDTEKHYEFSVTDTGTGIALADQKKLFHSFQQADTSSTREFNGIGLGLAISKRLVEKMGGTIGFESQPEKGSRFYFDIKLKSSDVDFKNSSDLHANE